MVDEHLTLQQIDGQDWGNPEAGETGMVAKCRRLRRTPLKDLSVSDLRLLIGQEIGLTTLVPRALLRVSSDPLTEGDYYPGDLLSVLLRVKGAYWSENPDELVRLVSIAKSVETNDRKVVDECRAFLAAYPL
ncbi:hypothetical protein JQ604_14770 [Bradyrhizobium jicamae]|uniref:contact-dependent growth inhibition system immunity protein n=1 Tax=Bradyrhizobium jicamae TaxID=280332 RepID=UPI001BABACF0|nr:contact-dependent growth inhibition system immunity protein [Bradyrhizobium jicamae]MBR0753448.1 hypothetical protein [Bradyrhizobium jicamae]